MGALGLLGLPWRTVLLLECNACVVTLATDATTVTDATLATDATESLQFHNLTTLTMRTNTTKRSQSQRYDSTTVRFGA